jgi:D-alanine-D-alanine ligase
MKPKRVLVITHPQHRPDRGNEKIGTEADVWRALKKLGHVVHIAGVNENLDDLEMEIDEFRPQIVFNLLEEYLSEAVYDFHIVSYLEAKQIPFTGCNPRGLIFSRNKFLLGQAANGMDIKTPKSFLTGRGFGRLPKELPPFPLFVKLNREHASLGIRESNLVRTEKQLKDVCRRLTRDFGGEILVQKFTAGEDVSVSVWGNDTAEVFHPRQLKGGNGVATARLKFSRKYQRKHRVSSLEYKGASAAKIRDQALSIYRHFDLSGYARIDFRVRDNADPVLIDVNANPNLAVNEDFALSARKGGWNYLDAVEHILELGFNYKPRV